MIKDNNISLIGKSNVAVLIDYKIVHMSGEELINFLKSIPADDIQRIEVITTPPAKYDAEGNSGLINIVYKKGRKNTTFSYNKNRLKLWTSIDGQTGYETSEEMADIYYPLDTWNEVLNSKNKQDHLSGRLALDYDISDRSSIGIQYLGNIATPSDKDQNHINMFNSDSDLTSYSLSEGNSKKLNKSHSLNMHYIQTLDSMGRIISLDLDYFNYEINQDRVFTSENFLPAGISIDYLSALNQSEQKINNYGAKIDMEHPTKFAQLSYGIKATATQTDSRVSYFNTISGNPLLDPAKSDGFKYKEDLYAAYIDASKEINKQWQMKFGLRVEQTQTIGLSRSYGQEDKNHYAKLFPSLYVLHKINDKNSINLNYGRRIKRPEFWELNPFRWYMNATSYSVGNPFLQPSFSDNLELTYSYNYKLSSTLMVSRVQNGFSQVPTIDVVNQLQIYIRQNYFTAYMYGYSQTYLFNKYAWWQNINQAVLYYSQTHFTNKDIQAPAQNGLGFNMSTNNTFKLNKAKTMEGELNASANFPNKDVLYQITPSYSVDIGFRILFWNNDLQIGVSAQDIFKTSTTTVTTFTDGIKQTYNIYNDNRRFRLAIVYKSGNSKISIKERSFGNEDIKNRAKQS